jgi:PBSX family phage terminase large subunit
LNGSVGTGKTRAACAEIVRLLLTDPRWIGKKFLICGITAKHVRDLLVEEVVKVLKWNDAKGKSRGLRANIDYKLNMYPSPVITFPIATDGNGTPSKIEFYTLQAGENVKGFNVSGVYGDDLSETDKETWDSICDRAGREEDGIIRIIGTCNPTTQQSWLYKNIFGPAEKGELPDQEMYFIESFTMWDNPALKDRWKILQARYKIGTVEYRRKILGEWCSQDGLCLPSFDNINNVMAFEDMAEYIRDGVSYTGQDFGGRDPTTCVWLSKYRDKKTNEDKFYVYREYYNKTPGTPVSTHAREILKYTEHVQRRYSDIGEIVNTYKEYGINLIPSPKTPGSVVGGLALINDLLSQKRLYIAKECVNLIREITSLEWKQNTIRDEPRPGGDHLIDPLRYICLEIAQGYHKITSFFGTEQTMREVENLPTIISEDNTPQVPDYKRELNELNDKGLVFIGFNKGKPLYARSP